MRGRTVAGLAVDLVDTRVSSTESKVPWEGFLHIAGNFSYYDALVDTASTPYAMPVNCLVFSTSAAEAFANLDSSTPPACRELPHPPA